MSSSPFSDAYADVVAGLASRDFSTEKAWADTLKRARKLCAADGFDVGEAALPGDFRKTLAKAAAKGTTEAASLFAFAGENLSGTGANPVIGTDLAKRLGALKVIRHTWLLKRFGGHRVWCVGVPPAYREWPAVALKGDLPAAVAKLTDTTDRFTAEDRKHLGDASQKALAWVHKAMMVAGDMKKKRNFERVARWFADATSTDNDVVAMGATLNAGLKKLAATLKSGRLVCTDHVAARGTPDFDGVEAFVWGDRLDVVYIENEFFGSFNTLSGLVNWTRIVIHELTHRELNTDDHAYEHQGMAPKKIGAAKALDNADSWAWFCVDCGGALTEAQITAALSR